MGKWRNTRTGDVADVPEALDTMYKARDEWEPFKEEAPAKSGKSTTQDKA